MAEHYREAVKAGLADRIQDVSRNDRDLADTADTMMALDLIVSVDTGPGHLAGALGRPTWLLLSHVADWRWLQDRSDSPWYPGHTLYRQEQAGEWSGVVQRVRADLEARL